MGATEMAGINTSSPHHAQKNSIKSYNQALLLQHDRIKNTHDTNGVLRDPSLPAVSRGGTDTVPVSTSTCYRYQSATISSAAHVGMSPAHRFSRTNGTSASASSGGSAVMYDQNVYQPDVPMTAENDPIGLKKKKGSLRLETFGKTDDDLAALKKKSNMGLTSPKSTSTNPDALVSYNHAALARDRHRLPSRRASLEEGLWPAASTIGLSASKRFGRKSVADKEGYIAIDKQDDERGNNVLLELDRFDASMNTLRPSEGTKHRTKTVQPFTETVRSPSHNSPWPSMENSKTARRQLSPNSHTMEGAMKLIDAKSRSGRKVKVRTTSSPSSEREKGQLDGASLGKQLGQHFENLDSARVQQHLVQSADGDESRSKLKKKSSIAANTYPSTMDNMKPVEKYESKLECILEVPAPKNASTVIAKVRPSSTLLTRAVASFLAPSRYKSHSSKREDKPAGPTVDLIRSASHSPGSFTSKRLDAKVVRSFSMDGRDGAAVAARTLKGGVPLKGAGLPSNQTADRCTRSLNGFESIDSSGAAASDTESLSYRGSAARLGVLNNQSWDSTVSPTSFVRLYKVKNGSQGGMDAADGVLSSRTTAGRGGMSEANGYVNHNRVGWEAILQSTRRSDYYIALDVALLLNRYIQWRFLNASVNASILAQAVVAENSLYNTCISLSQLNTLVAFQKMAHHKAMQDLKLDSILQHPADNLEKWDLLEQGHSMAIDNLVRALEAAVGGIPLIGGVHTDPRSLKNALDSAMSCMEGLSSSTSNLLPQAETVGSLLSEMADIAVVEKGYLEELRELFSTVSLLEMEERSLRASLMQMNMERVLKINRSG